MDIIIVKDGTVPIIVGRVHAVDGDAGLIRESLQASDAHQYLELFEVPDGARYVGVAWFDGEGFTVYGWRSIMDALRWLGEWDEAWDTAITEYDERHWGATYAADTDREGYGHVFAL